MPVIEGRCDLEIVRLPGLGLHGHRLVPVYAPQILVGAVLVITELAVVVQLEINVSSIAGLVPAPFTSTYGATKAYLVSLTEGLSEELRGTGVKVQVLCPGFTRTEFQANANVDATRIPSALWMTAEAVVDESLRALGRGTVLCIPGFKNRVYGWSLSLTPRGLVRRIGGIIGKSLPS